jgi:hypothetical protein
MTRPLVIEIFIYSNYTTVTKQVTEESHFRINECQYGSVVSRQYERGTVY